MARNVTLKNKAGDIIYPKTSVERIVDFNEALQDYVPYDELDFEVGKLTKDFLDKTTADSQYASKESVSDKVAYKDLDNLVKYGVFTVNGVPVLDKEVVLEVGKVYELRGYLHGHINVYSPTGGDKTMAVPEMDTAAANTQLILKGVYIESDRPEAIYCNQKAKKLAITYYGDNTIKSVKTGEYIGVSNDSPALIEVDNSLYLIGHHNATMNLYTDYDAVHGIKAQELFLQGDGTIEVSAPHDGFHGTHVLKTDGGKYIVQYAKDAFGTGNGGKIFILRGEYNIIQCYENGFDAKGKGIITGPETKIKFTYCGAGLVGKYVYVSEDVPAIAGYTAPRSSYSTIYGPGKVYQGNDEDLPEEEVLQSYIEVPLGPDGYYTVNTKNAWCTGYITHPIKMTKISSDLYFKNACIETNDETGSVIYTTGSKKLACRGVEDTLNMIFNTGNGDGIWSGGNCSLQGDGSFLISAPNGIALNCSGNTAYGLESNMMGTFQTKGNGTRMLYGSKMGAVGSKMHFGADDKLAAMPTDFYGQTMIFFNNETDMFVTPDPADIGEGKRTCYIFIYFGQIGAVVYDTYGCPITATAVFETFARYKDKDHNLQTGYIQTKDSQTIICMKDIHDSLTNDELEAMILKLIKRVEKLEAGGVIPPSGDKTIVESVSEDGYAILRNAEVTEDGYLKVKGAMVDEENGIIHF